MNLLAATPAPTGDDQNTLQLNSSTDSVETLPVSFALVKATASNNNSFAPKLTKTLTRDGDKIIKEAGANLSSGRATAITMDFYDLPDFFNRADEHSAITHGVFTGGFHDKKTGDWFADIVSKAKKSKSYGSNEGVIARTLDFFDYPKSPGIAVLDVDDVGEWGAYYSPFEIIAKISEIVPGFKGCAKIIRHSVSGGVHREEESPSPEPRSFRIYFPVLDASDLPRFAKALEGRTWLNGHGFIKLAKDGAMLKQTLFDPAVFSPERIDYVAKPVLGKGLLNTLKEATVVQGGYLYTQALQDLSHAQLKKIEDLEASAKAGLKARSEVVRAQWLDARGGQMQSQGALPELVEKFKQDYKASEGSVLNGDFVVETLAFGPKTVRELLAAPTLYHNAACADPVEGPDDGYGRAWIHSDQKQPNIFSFKHGGRTASSGNDGGDWQSRLKAHVADLNQTYASVNFNGKHRIMTSRDGEFSFMPRAELTKCYDHLPRIQTGESAWSSYIMAWAMHKDCIAYPGGVHFRPGSDLPEDQFNMWRGFAVEPVQNDKLLKLIYYHIKHVICSSDEALFNHFIRHVAFCFQNLGVVAGVAVVLRGLKGCGKGVPLHFIRSIFGSHGMHISNGLHFTGRFNAHLASTAMLFVDEAYFAGNRENEGVLKAFVTEPSYRVEPKGIDNYNQINYLKIFMATNSDWAVPVSADERRYFVLDVSDKHLGDHKYFDRLTKACATDEAKSAFLFDMLHMDLTGFNIRRVPDTAALRSQKLLSLSPLKRWVLEALLRGSFKVPDKDYYHEPPFWEDWLSSDELIRHYQTFCTDNKISGYSVSPSTSVGTYLGKVFVGVKHKGVRGYYLGSLSDAIAKFEGLEKIIFDELVTDKKG
jgi:hypothetical protein